LHERKRLIDTIDRILKHVLRLYPQVADKLIKIYYK
jgi:hypothetical protein